MTQPLLAHQTAVGRMYSRSVSGLPEVPSITTVIAQQATDMTGWAGYMAATDVINDQRLANAVGNNIQLRAIARDAADAAARFRDDAAARGDRVHNYAEQVALRELGEPHTLDQTRQTLIEHGEIDFAHRFDEWWDTYRVKPLAAETTVWNSTVGYAGTLDLIAEIGGRRCLIDFKTKGTDRNGRVKPLDSKVVMQLTAGYKAEELLVDGHAGTWEPWSYGDDLVLLAVAIGTTEVVTYQASPQVLPEHWRQFVSLHKVWAQAQKVENAGQAMLPIGPPA